jgi:hypothetical protein
MRVALTFFHEAALWTFRLPPRLISVWRRATGEDMHFQMLAEVQEALSCLTIAELSQDVTHLVDTHNPAELRREAMVQLHKVERRLRYLGVY